MTITTTLTKLAGIRHPILLAPMGDVAGGRLAAAVSDAGGLGLIGGGYGDPAALERELLLAGEARVGIGFITFALDARPDSLRIALDHGPAAVQLSFGDPSPYVDRIHAAGALLIVQIQTVAEARRAAELGADIVIAQGQDSGGHGRPGRGTMGLTPAVVDAVAPIPAVAAGGLADGRGLAAALALGAAGVALGTRLYASSEAISDRAAQRLLMTSTGDDTVRTPAFDIIRGPAWPPDYDGRALRNATTRQWETTPYQLSSLHATYAAAAETDYSVKALWAGEGLDLIHTIEPAANIINTMVIEACERLADLSSSVSSRPQP